MLGNMNISGKLGLGFGVLVLLVTGLGAFSFYAERHTTYLFDQVASLKDPIERLWGLMHKHVTHNKCYAKVNDFCNAMLTFLRDEVPKNWQKYSDSVTDNFRVFSPKNFRVLA